MKAVGGISEATTADESMRVGHEEDQSASEQPLQSISFKAQAGGSLKQYFSNADDIVSSIEAQAVKSFLEGMRSDCQREIVEDRLKVGEYLPGRWDSSIY